MIHWRTAQIFWVPPIISGTGKATNFNFCTHILSIDRNKSPLQISRKVAGCVVRTLKTFQGTHILGYCVVKVAWATVNRLWLIHPCDGRTDGRILYHTVLAALLCFAGRSFITFRFSDMYKSFGLNDDLPDDMSHLLGFTPWIILSSFRYDCSCPYIPITRSSYNPITRTQLTKSPLTYKHPAISM